LTGSLGNADLSLLRIGSDRRLVQPRWGRGGDAVIGWSRRFRGRAGGRDVDAFGWAKASDPLKERETEFMGERKRGGLD
jgi:hypothetical protein